MANERRVRNDAVFGTLSVALTDVATTMNGAGLANLEAIDATEHAVIVLDPRRTAGAPEIVYVTAHTGSATTATVVRGREGTTARAHALSVEWLHGPTSNEYVGLSRLIVTRAAVQSIPDATLTRITWDTETIDTDGFLVAPSDTITIPAGSGGVYAVTARIEMAAAPTVRLLWQLLAGGVTWRVSAAPAGSETQLSISVIVALVASHTIQGFVFQDHTGALDATARLELYRLSP